MGLIKTINFEEKLDIIVTHILTGGGYLAIEQDTEFEKLVSMIREKQVPNILLDLTDDDGDKHYIKVKDVTLNDARDTIKMCVTTKDYYLEFALLSDGSFNRVVKSAIGVSSEITQNEKFCIKSVLNIDCSGDGQAIILPLSNYGVHLKHNKTYTLSVCDYIENESFKASCIRENTNDEYCITYNLVYGDNLSDINLNVDSLMIEVYLTGEGDRVTTTRNVLFTIEEI